MPNYMYERGAFVLASKFFPVSLTLTNFKIISEMRSFVIKRFVVS